MVNRVFKGVGKGNVVFKCPIYNETYLILDVYLRDFEVDDYVFRWKNIRQQRKKAYYLIKKEVGKVLPHKDKSEIYPHCFKHTLGCMLRERGFDLREIQTILRHKNLETVSHYTSVDNERLTHKLKNVFE